MEVYLDDGIGAEVEINLDEVEEVKKKPRKTRLLKKAEKKALLYMLGNLVSNSSEVVSAVTEIISKQNHKHLFKDREQLWTTLQSDRAQPLMTTLVKVYLYSCVQVLPKRQRKVLQISSRMAQTMQLTFDGLGIRKRATLSDPSKVARVLCRCWSK